MPSILIQIARRRQKPGSGSIPRIATPQPSRMFRHIFSVPYAVIGGQAARFYMPERSTLDWDVLIDLDQLDRARRDLLDAGARSVAPRTVPGFTCRLPAATILDVIAGDEEWIPLALAEAETRGTRDDDPVLPLEWLVLLKLRAGRVQDHADVSRMMGHASQPDLEATRLTLARWLPDASEDLDSLIELGKLETGK